MPQLFANNAVGTLNAGIAAGDTTVVLQAGQGARFPSANAGTNPVSDSNNWFKVTLDDGAGNLEIVYVRTTSGDTFSNVLRGQEGTTPRAYTSSASASIRVTAVDMEAAIFGGVTLNGTQTLTNKTIIGAREARVAMGANNVDLLAGNFFTKTISGATTFTVSNVPAAGTAASFILDLTNGGSGAITWWSGMKWAGGTAPTLTASGRDCLGFFTHDGGATWTGLLLGKDIK